MPLASLFFPPPLLFIFLSVINLFFIFRFEWKSEVLSEMEKEFLQESAVGRGGASLKSIEARVAERLGLTEQAVKSIVRRHKNESELLSEKSDYNHALTDVDEKVPHLLWSIVLISLSFPADSRWSLSRLRNDGTPN